MIREFALEPTLLNNWPSFRYFVEKFGVPQGRLISRYPKPWKRLVYDSLGTCGDIEKKHIEEGLRRIDDRILKRPNSLWNNEQNWLWNAETEHARKPFHAIIATANPNQKDFVLEGNGLDETNPTWQVPRSQVVPREAVAMARCVAPLLRSAAEILFIDPHFNPERPKWRNPLREFLNAIFYQRDDAPPHRIEFHTSGDDTKPASDHFTNICARHLPQLIPTGVELRIIRWRQRAGGDEFHNRYILTRSGGVSFQVGLDEGESGETDDVSLLDSNVHTQRWNQFDLAHPAFDLADQVVVRGTRR